MILWDGSNDNSVACAPQFSFQPVCPVLTHCMCCSEINARGAWNSICNTIFKKPGFFAVRLKDIHKASRREEEILRVLIARMLVIA